MQCRLCDRQVPATALLPAYAAVSSLRDQLASAHIPLRDPESSVQERLERCSAAASAERLPLNFNSNDHNQDDQNADDVADHIQKGIRSKPEFR